jgi:hypothetical protein
MVFLKRKFAKIKSWRACVKCRISVPLTKKGTENKFKVFAGKQ